MQRALVWRRFLRQTRARASLVVYTNIVYTRGVLDRVDGFEWDVHNAGHIARHGVTPQEVEDAVCGAHVVIPAKAVRGEKRWKLFGRSEAGRYLVVVFTIRQNRLRPVTAYTMNETERGIYGSQID